MTAAKKEKQVFTREQVIELLKKQIERCAQAAEGNCSEYTAKKKVKETKILEV